MYTGAGGDGSANPRLNHKLFKQSQLLVEAGFSDCTLGHAGAALPAVVVPDGRKPQPEITSRRILATTTT